MEELKIKIYEDDVFKREMTVPVKKDMSFKLDLMSPNKFTQYRVMGIFTEKK